MIEEFPITKDMVLKGTQIASKLWEIPGIGKCVPNVNEPAYFGIGEAMAMEYLKPHGPEYVGSFGYDIRCNDLKIDVKTKRTNVAPSEWFECSVYKNINLYPEVDLFFFTFLEFGEEPDDGWIAGCIDKKTFYAKAHWVNAGSTERHSHGSYQILIKYLKEFKDYV